MRRLISPRVLFGLTAVIIFGALVLQVVLAAGNEEGHFATPAGRAINVLFFFTIQSNILVAVGCAILARNPATRTKWFGALRLAGLVGITITGVVYHLLLRQLYDLSGGDMIADVLLHTVSPLLAVGGWLLFGPRGLFGEGVMSLALLFPAVWGAITVIRGALLDWYPYPFIDVLEIGYLRAGANGAGIVAGYGLVAWVIILADRRLSSRRGSGWPSGHQEAGSTRPH